MSLHAISRSTRKRTAPPSSGGRRGGRCSRRAPRQCLILGVTALIGCDTLLEVENPDRVTPELLESPANAELLVKSVKTDFECAFTNYNLAQALLGDEMTWGDLNSYELERRDIPPTGTLQYAVSPCATAATSPGVVLPLSTSHVAAADAHRIISSFSDSEVPEKATYLATVSAYDGYSVLLLGEGMCSAVLDLGPELSRQQLFERAEELFTRAISEAQDAGAQDVLNLARVGRARVRLNQDRKADAADDARTVPDGFVFNAEYAGEPYRASNLLYRHSNFENRSGIEDDFFDLEWEGVPDPRVPLEHLGKLVGGVRDGGERGTGGYPLGQIEGMALHDGFTPRVIQQKYTSSASPIPIARWEEAQLIIAEAVLGQEAVDIINELHRRVGLPATFQASTDAEIMAQVIEERSRELFLESHHLYDQVRYDIPFTPAAGTSYKTLTTFYRDATCFPLPDVEKNGNPNF